MKCDQRRNWWTLLWVGLLAPRVLWASDYELAKNVYPAGDALRLSHNSPEAVTSEINDRSIRELLAKAAGVTNLLPTEAFQLVVTADERPLSVDASPLYGLGHYYTIKYPSLEARELFSARFQLQIEKYLGIRLAGHTRQFAVASFSRNTKRAVSRPTSKDIVLRVYKEVPDSWLTLWKEDGKAVGYCVVDGELVWTFRFSGQSAWLEVVDGQEFDPKLKQVFADAGKKAKDNLTARGVVRRLGYCHSYWPELKKVLREEYKIHWWCPTDLNEGSYD
jgi:hypothetical protein